MSKHQIGYTVFGVFTIVYLLGSIFYSWSLFYYFIFFLVWFLLVVLGSFVIRLNYHLKAVSHVPTNEKVVALTFDDGPTEYTQAVLALLRSHQFKGTFFCIGRQIEKYPKIVKECFDEGHLIGNHTFSHSQLTGFRNMKKMIKEIRQTDKRITSITNAPVHYFRPPFGVTNPSIMRALKRTGHIVIGWNVRSLDTVKNNEEKIYNRIIKQIKPGSIVLLHDTSKKSIQVLERLLSYLVEHDFRCLTVEELLKFKK